MDKASNILMTISGSHQLNSTSKTLLGVSGLAECVEYETMVYILRVLYRIIFKSKRLNENKHQLQQRIQRFEIQSKLPGCLSALPIDKLLNQLEDAQYRYPIRRYETTLPRFP